MIKSIIQGSMKNPLLYSAAIYVFTNVLNAAIPFLIMPVLTHYMSPQEYGVLALFQALVGLFLPFIGLSLHAAISRKFYEKDHINYSLYVGNCLLLVLIATCIVTIFLLIFNHDVGVFTSFPAEWLWAVVVSAAGQSLVAMMLVQWQVTNRPITYGTFRIAQTATDIGFSLLFVIGLGMSWQGRIESQVLAAALFGMISLWFIVRNCDVKLRVNSQYMKDALKFGIPLIPHTLCNFVISLADRFIIAYYIGLSELGIYTVGYQFGMAVGLIENSFNQAWVPWFFKKLKNNTAADKRNIVKITYGYFCFMIILALAVWIGAPLVLKYFFSASYQKASDFVLWVALGHAFNGMYKIVVNYIFYIEKTYILVWVIIISAMVHLGANCLLIKQYGIIGAAYATTITFMIKFLGTWILSAKLYPMPWTGLSRRA